MSENSNAIKVVSQFAKPARADGLRAAMHPAVGTALDLMGIEGDPTPKQWSAAALVAMAGLQLQAGDIHDEQAGPLSPFLSNIVLDELDQELARRGLRFVRHADDANIFVRSERAGQRVMQSVRRFLEKRMRLQVNEAKSGVRKP
jgi:hypothetical protein